MNQQRCDALQFYSFNSENYIKMQYLLESFYINVLKKNSMPKSIYWKDLINYILQPAFIIKLKRTELKSG